MDVIKRYGPPNNKLDLAVKGTVCEVVLPDKLTKAVYVQNGEDMDKPHWEFVDIIPAHLSYNNLSVGSH